MSLAQYSDLALLRVIEVFKVFKVESRPTLAHPRGLPPNLADQAQQTLNQLNLEAANRGLVH